MLDLFKIKDDFLLKKKEKILQELQGKSSVWDPSSYVVSVEQIASHNAKTASQYDKLKNGEIKPKNTFYKLLGGSIIATIASIAISSNFNEGGGNLVMFVMFGGGALTWGYLAKMKQLGKDLVKLQIANKKGWVYEPEKNRSMWLNYTQIFPEVFIKGDENQNLEDVFWGKFKHGTNINDFVSGNFAYTTVSTDSKGHTHRTVHSQHFFVIRLPKMIKSNFILKPEGVFSKIGNFFTKKEINTESTEFNKTFAFSYNGKKDEKALEIVKILSPRVQEELVRLNNEGSEKKGVSVFFKADTVLFSFNGVMIPKMETDFIFKSLELNTDDIKIIDDKLTTLTSISGEIVKYLD